MRVPSSDVAKCWVTSRFSALNLAGEVRTTSGSAAEPSSPRASVVGVVKPLMVSHTSLPTAGSSASTAPMPMTWLAGAAGAGTSLKSSRRSARRVDCTCSMSESTRKSCVTAQPCREVEAVGSKITRGAAPARKSSSLTAASAPAGTWNSVPFEVAPAQSVRGRSSRRSRSMSTTTSSGTSISCHPAV